LEAQAFHPNDSRDFRTKYLSTLVKNKVYEPPASRPPKSQTVFIFDWDDTLLCTSWLRDHGDSDPATRARLDAIAGEAKELLELVSTLGETFIVTNAQSGWVEYCVSTWCPSLASVLGMMRVVSARDMAVANFPEDPVMWKIEAFRELRKQFSSDVVTNLVVLGDAEYEMNAARIMAAEFNLAMVKTVKFQPLPTPLETLQQLRLINSKIEKIFGAPRNLTVSLERTRKGSKDSND